jgi:hypothetical protein
MSKAAKFIVLGAGILGLIGFFLPLISVQKSGIEGKLSAFQIVKGLDSAQDVVGEAHAAAGTAEDKAAVAEANEALGAVKGIVLALFVPAFLLALFGGIGAAKKRFGRGLGVTSLLIGLVGLGIWALLSSAAEGSAGVGLHMLLLTGLGGIGGGLIATVKPDRGMPAMA